MSDALRDQQLQVEIIDGRLIISIGIDLLIGAALENDAIDNEEITVTDYDVFAQEIVYKLEAEEEDGTTIIHKAFDQAAQMALDDGCDGVSFSSDEEQD